MTPRQFAALAAAAALSLIAAVAVYTASAPWTRTTASAGKLLPGLAADAPNVARISITQGGTTAAIERAGDQWLIRSQDGYPASTEKVHTFLTALIDAELAEPKTANPDRFAILEVDDPGATAASRLIKLEDESGATLAEVIAGKTRFGQAGVTVAGTYVRRPGDNQSWLADKRIVGAAALRDWAHPRVFEVQTETVSRATVEIPGEAPYAISRSESGKSHRLDTIPTGKKIRYINVVDNIIEAASFLDLEGVRKATGGKGGEAGTATLELDSGLKIAVSVRREKDAAWATVAATGEGDAKQAAADIMRRAEGWEFEVMPSKVATMLKKLDELVEDEEPEEPSDAQAQTPGGIQGLPGIPGLPGPGPGPGATPGPGPGPAPGPGAAPGPGPAPSPPQP